MAVSSSFTAIATLLLDNVRGWELRYLYRYRTDYIPYQQQRPWKAVICGSKFVSPITNNNKDKKIAEQIWAQEKNPHLAQIWPNMQKIAIFAQKHSFWDFTKNDQQFFF